MSADIECIVIGAGVVGLAIAKKLADEGHDVLVCEKTDAIGTQTSSRNSEVIHAGIYYPSNSLKARLCVEGKAALYRYCDERNIAYQRLGKLLVASSPEQFAKLQQLEKQAKDNGVHDLQWLDAEQIKALEPELKAQAALLSPSTGIINSHELMVALQGDAENKGAQLVFLTPFLNATPLENGLFLCSFGGQEPMQLSCRYVINAAGLHAPSTAKQINNLDPSSIPPEYYCKGNYFTYSGKAPFKHLIYPMPNNAGLGVHVTLDLGGQAKFGPDTEWIEQINYDMDATRVDSFYQAIREYWPSLPDGSLQTGYTGIRPKISASHEAAADFVFSGPRDHGMTGLINLYGIESPGLTACLAIADYAYEKLMDKPQ